jgi:hypothetical protein
MPINQTAEIFELHDSLQRPFFSVEPHHLDYDPEGLFKMCAFGIDGADIDLDKPIPIGQLRSFDYLLGGKNNPIVEERFFPEGGPNTFAFRQLLRDIIAAGQLQKFPFDSNRFFLAGCPDTDDKNIPVLSVALNKECPNQSVALPNFSLLSAHFGDSEVLPENGIDTSSKIVPSTKFILETGDEKINSKEEQDCIFADLCTRALSKRICNHLTNRVAVKIH